MRYSDPLDQRDAANYGRQESFVVEQESPRVNMANLTEAADIERVAVIQRANDYQTDGVSPWLAPGLWAQVEYGAGAGPPLTRLVRVPHVGMVIPCSGRAVRVFVQQTAQGIKLGETNLVTVSASPRAAHLSSWIESDQLGVAAIGTYRIPNFAIGFRLFSEHVAVNQTVWFDTSDGVTLWGQGLSLSTANQMTMRPMQIPLYASQMRVTNGSGVVNDIGIEWFIRS